MVFLFQLFFESDASLPCQFEIMLAARSGSGNRNPKTVTKCSVAPSGAAAGEHENSNLTFHVIKNTRFLIGSDRGP